MRDAESLVGTQFDSIHEAPHREQVPRLSIGMGSYLENFLVSSANVANKVLVRGQKTAVRNVRVRMELILTVFLPLLNQRFLSWKQEPTTYIENLDVPQQMSNWTKFGKVIVR